MTRILVLILIIMIAIVLVTIMTTSKNPQLRYLKNS